MIHVKHTLEPDTLQFTLTKESYEGFYMALQRALNCWPDHPPELLALSDAMEEHLFQQPKT